MSGNQPPQGPQGPQDPYRPGQQGPPQQGPQGPYHQGPYQQGPQGQPPQGPYQQGPYQQGPNQQWQGWQPVESGPPEPTAGKKRKGLVIGAVGAALALLVAGGGVVAWSALSGGGPQPAEALPDSALAYARVDLDPSASQKVDIIRLLRRVPEFSEATGIDGNSDDLRRVLFEKATEDSSCGVDYEDDVEPWIGDRAAMAAVPVDDSPEPVFVLQTTDQDAAEEGIEALSKCGNEGSSDPGVTFAGDYAVIAEKQSIADDVAADAEDAPLSEDATFSDDMEKLGDQGVASFWADGGGFAELSERVPNAEAMQTQGVESVAGAVRAGSDYIELATVTHQKSPIETDARSDVADLPESTVFAASIAGGGDKVEDGWSAFAESMSGMSYSFESQLDSFEQSTGLSLPADLETLVGENVTLAVDERGLGSLAGMAGPADFSGLGVGIKMTTDKAAANDLVDRINASLGARGVPELATKETDDGLVLATSDDYAGELAGSGSLGSADSFSTVVPDAGEAIGVAYLNVDKVSGILEEQAPPDGGADEVLEALDPIEAVGISAKNGQDGRNSALMRVSFD